MSKPYCRFFESSCGLKTFGRALVILGAEVALSAVFIYDVGEADCHCDTGYCSAETPVVFHPVCLVVGEGHEVHIALFKFSQSLRKMVLYALTPIGLQVLHMHLQFYLRSAFEVRADFYS